MLITRHTPKNSDSMEPHNSAEEDYTIYNTTDQNIQSSKTT